MLRYFIKRAHEETPFFPRPRVIVGIPSGVTEVEKRAVYEAALSAGAREAYMIEEPMAAAIGSGLPIQEAAGSMIVDIGGGTTEVAVISLGGIVVNHSVRTAGDAIDQQIIDYLRDHHHLLIGERTAEVCKMEIGSALPNGDEPTTFVRGRDLNTGLPRALEVNSGEIHEAISGTVNEIIDNVKLALETTPPELLGDVMENGMHLAGGGALLGGFNRALEQATDVSVVTAKNPLEAVVRGTGTCLQNISAYREIFIADNDYSVS
jgi:rod shape-determining protein MreB